MNDLIHIKINGQAVQAQKGETILNICKSLGIEIPYLCHDPKLKPFSSCFICVVAIKGFRTHQPSCSTIATDGMEIETDSPEVRASRKMALELMLSNHYADCLAPCTLTCPAGVDVQGYLSLIEKKQYQQAVALIKETNPLPAICGRVCVRPCEAACRRHLTEDNQSVGIDYLKRYVTDFDFVAEQPVTPTVKPLNGKKVAVVGGGPGGLSAAHYLQINGFQVDIYERAHAAGGWLRFGIPEYRLPNAVLDKEIKNITDLGVRIFPNNDVGKDVAVADLDKNYDAILISIGAQDGDLLGIGESESPNLVAGIDFLKKNAETNNETNLSGKRVVVVGGGNTAMDCCRSARRCGSDDVIVLYRRTEADMPANPIEIHESKVEGVQYLFLSTPIGVIYDDNGLVTGLKCIKMKAEKQPGSRRSSIVPIEGSEFDLPCDLVLPATGQKIQHPVLEVFNEYYAPESLQLNRWQTLDANEQTMQMNIPKIFAVGDAVTGPTNIIEAIGGGKKAAKYIAAFITDGTTEKVVQAYKKPFVSKKDIFEKQQREDYTNRFQQSVRYEMPVLDEGDRNNFNEVELGYNSEEKAVCEAERCLECGCVAFYDCKLQQYATEYGAQQTTYKGHYQKFAPCFGHPHIEIDNNKCILCGRCVRVCKEYTGNNALGFMNRGSKTFIAPNIEGDLNASKCDSCGLCIDTCPTGALHQNYQQKTLALPFKKLPTIDPFGSEGFEIDILEHAGRIYGTTARIGMVNHWGLINRETKLNYDIWNKEGRITQPMLRKEGKLLPISTQEALAIIHEKITSDKEGKHTGFLVGATLTNEQIYMVQKLARACVKTNAITSSYFLDKTTRFNIDKNDNLPLGEIYGAKHIVIVGGDLPNNHPVVSHLVQNCRNRLSTPVTLLTHLSENSLKHRVDTQLLINDYAAFIKCVNYYIVKNQLQKGIFTTGLALQYEEYIEKVKQFNFEELLQQANVTMEVVQEMATQILATTETVFILSEKGSNRETFYELKNLMLLTEKQGKTFSGLMLLKEHCNTQGLFDMGAHHEYGPGFREIEEEYLQLLSQVWGVESLSSNRVCTGTLLHEGRARNLFVVGDNIVASHPFVLDAIAMVDFVCVQSLFENETTALAHLVLPMNFAVELGGSFTSTFKVAQTFEAILPAKINWNDYQFYAQLHEMFGVNSPKEPAEIFMEMIALLQPGCCSGNRHCFEV